MTWFHPKTLLDKTYEVGIIIKGIDGTIEIITGTLLAVLTPAAFLSLTSHLGRSGDALTHHRLATVLFLLSHGIVKVVLVVCLLLNKLWAYPGALIALGGFTVYQMYQIITSPNPGIIFLTVLNVVIMGLIYREWQEQLKTRATPPVKD